MNEYVNLLFNTFYYIYILVYISYLRKKKTCQTNVHTQMTWRTPLCIDFCVSNRFLQVVESTNTGLMSNENRLYLVHEYKIKLENIVQVKLGTERQIPHVLSYMWILKEQNSRKQRIDWGLPESGWGKGA
jgi:hypothetical protein